MGENTRYWVEIPDIRREKYYILVTNTRYWDKILDKASIGWN